MYEFKYPFTPPEEDLVTEVIIGNGIRCTVYDTFCKDFRSEEKAEKDKKIMEIYTRAAQRKFLEEMKHKK